MDVVHERCAGLDVHKDEVVACARVVTGRRVQRTRGRFPTTTRGLLALADWLAEHRCCVGALEATGVYWKPVSRARGDGRAPPAQPRARPRDSGAQERHERCDVVGGSDGPWSDPRELRAPTRNSGDPGPHAHPEATGAADRAAYLTPPEDPGRCLDCAFRLIEHSDAEAGGRDEAARIRIALRLGGRVPRQRAAATCGRGPRPSRIHVTATRPPR